MFEAQPYSQHAETSSRWRAAPHQSPSSTENRCSSNTACEHGFGSDCPCNYITLLLAHPIHLQHFATIHPSKLITVPVLGFEVCLAPTNFVPMSLHLDAGSKKP